jgi:hypothetical protein
MMKELRIKTESLPARCEVCHQSDLFDAATNHCRRCQTLLEAREDHPAKADNLPAPGLRQRVFRARDAALESLVKRSMRARGIADPGDATSTEIQERVFFSTIALLIVAGAVIGALFHPVGVLIGLVCGLLLGAILGALLAQAATRYRKVVSWLARAREDD